MSDHMSDHMSLDKKKIADNEFGLGIKISDLINDLPKIHHEHGDIHVVASTSYRNSKYMSWYGILDSPSVVIAKKDYNMSYYVAIAQDGLDHPDDPDFTKICIVD